MLKKFNQLTSINKLCLRFGHRAHFAGEIGRRLGLPYTLTRQAFRRKLSPNRRNLKTLALRFSVDKNRFEKRAFPKGCGHDNHTVP